MTTELEKKFFETFGIEERCEKDKHCCNWLCDSYQYPQITDRILLELICKTSIVITEDCNSVKKLKNGVLKVLINLAQINNDIKHQVQELFKGEK